MLMPRSSSFFFNQRADEHFQKGKHIKEDQLNLKHFNNICHDHYSTIRWLLGNDKVQKKNDNNEKNTKVNWIQMTRANTLMRNGDNLTVRSARMQKHFLPLFFSVVFLSISRSWCGYALVTLNRILIHTNTGRCSARFPDFLCIRILIKHF